MRARARVVVKRAKGQQVTGTTRWSACFRREIMRGLGLWGVSRCWRTRIGRTSESSLLPVPCLSRPSCLFRTSGQCALSKLKLPTVKLTTDNSRSHGNAAFIRDLTSWVFQETGVVKVTGTKHSRVGEVVPREQYTKMDNLVRLLLHPNPCFPFADMPRAGTHSSARQIPPSLFLPPFPLVSRPKPTRLCTPVPCIRHPLSTHCNFTVI